MNWTARTFLRLFLLVGGGLLSIDGLLGGDLLVAAIGAVAVVLGVVGLAAEWIETSG